MLICGDVHGKWDDLAKKLVSAGVEGEHIIQVGDFGIGFWNPSVTRKIALRKEMGALKHLRNVLRERGCVLHVVRGNHDDPSLFDGGAWECWPEIILHRDYSLIDAGGVRVLLVGGGISIDRCLRSDGYSWWSNEQVRWDPDALSECLRGVNWIDAVATHSAPNFCFPFTKNIPESFIERDKELISDCDNERATLTLLSQAISPLNPQRWFYGHFHASSCERIRGCTYVALAIMEIREWSPFVGEKTDVSA